MSETPFVVTTRISSEVLERLFTRDAEGNRLRVDWGEPDQDGFHTPTFTVDFTDNIAAHAQSDLAAQTQRADEAVALCGVLRAELERTRDWMLDTAPLLREDGLTYVPARMEQLAEEHDAALAATPAEAGERMRKKDDALREAKRILADLAEARSGPDVWYQRRCEWAERWIDIFSQLGDPS